MSFVSSSAAFISAFKVGRRELTEDSVVSL